MSEQEEPAPYGGIMVQSIEDENNRKKLLQEQAVEIYVNGEQQTIRPEAVHIRGVDSLSTQNIEAFINYYVNYHFVTRTKQDSEEEETVHESKPLDEQFKFRIQWVNDTSVNIVLSTHEQAVKTLEAISITASNPAIATENDESDPQAKLASLVQERETKPYNPVIEFEKRLNLAHRLGIEEPKPDSNMDEDESAVVLHARLAFQSDVKVKNASAYSRYYLLHGDPERKPYKRKPKPRRRHQRDYDDDLFADKLREKRRDRARGRDDEEDLFASKLRDRSPERNRSRSPMRTDD